ncbi:MULTISPECIES: hypothetical protein [unclassified Herbaspirillum]|uniref:hypothetical protein n=1 Tax=unclassified Herbaspirillum TaxID=2624150 RepID=UPI0010717A8A|nr:MULTISPECIES: hypothetical protein [unclassified Herbaspirillum]TFI08302.1 hypothetical protein E4P32_08995 [Herbaspirillum sp. 3R11]TFI14717.1 hypothetical protein E4P31_08990 [Herbaspirillum sp. 3R-11]TFI31891.1 hypothetical protein E4P30_00160 [Herbaspirillum sp. 3C11]TFI32026.1 hypothetical protein E4P30_00880 [Herbaspirillum sp. 3C11]
MQKNKAKDVFDASEKLWKKLPRKIRSDIKLRRKSRQESYRTIVLPTLGRDVTAAYGCLAAPFFYLSIEFPALPCRIGIIVCAPRAWPDLSNVRRDASRRVARRGSQTLLTDSALRVSSPDVCKALWCGMSLHASASTYFSIYRGG